MGIPPWGCKPPPPHQLILLNVISVPQPLAFCFAESHDDPRSVVNMPSVEYESSFRYVTLLLYHDVGSTDASPLRQVQNCLLLTFLFLFASVSARARERYL